MSVAKLAEKALELERCLVEFCKTVEATGGVRSNHRGNLYPIADEDWTDLGGVYFDACSILGRDPVIVKEGTDV